VRTVVPVTLVPAVVPVANWVDAFILDKIHEYDVGAIPVLGAVQLSDQLDKFVSVALGEIGLFGIPNAFVLDTDKLVVVSVELDKYVDM
jgi:hypothetical protein